MDIAIDDVIVALALLAKLIDGAIGGRAMTTHDGTEGAKLNPTAV